MQINRIPLNTTQRRNKKQDGTTMTTQLAFQLDNPEFCFAFCHVMQHLHSDTMFHPFPVSMAANRVFCGLGIDWIMARAHTRDAASLKYTHVAPPTTRVVARFRVAQPAPIEKIGQATQLETWFVVFIALLTSRAVDNQIRAFQTVNIDNLTSQPWISWISLACSSGKV
jgi:hypothetical protein